MWGLRLSALLKVGTVTIRPRDRWLMVCKDSLCIIDGIHFVHIPVVVGAFSYIESVRVVTDGCFCSLLFLPTPRLVPNFLLQ